MHGNNEFYELTRDTGSCPPSQYSPHIKNLYPTMLSALHRRDAVMTMTKTVGGEVIIRTVRQSSCTHIRICIKENVLALLGVGHTGYMCHVSRSPTVMRLIIPSPKFFFSALASRVPQSREPTSDIYIDGTLSET